MGTTTLVILVLAIPLVIGAVWVDRRRWTSKSGEELRAMLADGNWRYWKPALKELGRRGEDTKVHIPQLLPRLLANGHTEREAARITLVGQFPELRPHLEGYRASEDPSTSRQKLAALLGRYRAP